MNIKESEKATVASRITDKTVDYAIAKQDVGTTFDEIIDLLGAVLVNPDLTYPIGFIVYTASPYAIYVCKVNDSTGVVTNQTNWLKIAGSGLPYLVADTEVYDTNVAKQDSDYYVNLSIDMNAQAGVLFALRFVNKDSTQQAQLGYNVLVDATTALEGASLVLQTDNRGMGYSKLQITTSAGVYNEKLAISSTYLLTKTTDINDIDGYILTKIASTGCRLLTITGCILSTGKYFIPSGFTAQLPLAVGVEGETITLILTTSGSITVNTSGSDTINNIGGLSYNLPKMTFTSDGVDKWYYTA